MNTAISEKKWQRESDAHTLAEAEVIKKSPGRLKGAKVAAKELAKDAEKRANSYKKVAKPVAKPAKRKSSGPKAKNKSNAKVYSNTKIPGVKRR